MNFLITFRSTIIQGFLRKEPSQRHREFTDSKRFKLLTVGSAADPLPAAQYQHIAHALVPSVESELDPRQLRAVTKINSLDSAVLIHGPPGMGKTFGIAAALKNRVPPPPRAIGAAREMTVILTISNHAAINVAKALMDRNIIGFKLTMSRSAFDIATKGGNKDLIKLSDAKKVWLPHEAIEEAKRDPKRSATKRHKDVVRTTSS
jgi:hypothetical protein